jgi:threonine dehydratase
MADLSTCQPLTRSSVQAAHEKIKEHVHLTPVLTSRTLNEIASAPQSTEALKGTPFEGSDPAKPRIRLFFKCENFQRIGAFKVRGAFHALSRLPEDVRRKGIVTHSSGNPPG